MAVGGAQWGQEAEVVEMGLFYYFHQQQKPCYVDVEYESLKKEGMTGGLLYDTTPFVCGGRTGFDVNQWSSPVIFTNDNIMTK